VSERARRPLNQAATKAADDKIYADHAGNPRPNALYDADGTENLSMPTIPIRLISAQSG